MSSVNRQPALRGKLMRNEPMSRHTSWRLGGPADRYYVPADLEDLQYFLSTLDAETEVLWVGLGSNLLVRDGGFRGQVIAPLNALKRMELQLDGNLYVECGSSCARLAKFCQKKGLGGADFFAGIPGTVGGALAMNAGAFGGETWAAVQQAIMIDRQGRLHQRDAAEFDVGYRHVNLPQAEWFAAALFHFEPRPADEDSRIRQLLRQRNETQPIGEPSCGSVFKNPPGQHAAKLIEAAGLKGYQHGSARVSDKHANFIISNADTLSADVESLIYHIQDRIAQQFDVQLETEVRIVGEAS